MNYLDWKQQHPSILVVDDDKVIRTLIAKVMEKEGYQVTQVTNGLECLESYLKNPPDLVLLDAQMPVMDGFTCCQELKKLSAKNSIFNDYNKTHESDKILASIDKLPILMITGLDDEESVNKAFNVGATDYVTKPIHWAVLKQRVRRLLAQTRLYQQLEIANHELKRLVNIDSLTQLSNRRRFDEYLYQQWGVMARQEQPLSLILCDIDFFKFYNDTYGHQAGDQCLEKIANVISNQAKRAADLAARYGGEEMAVILPNTDSKGAFMVAENIRQKIASLKIIHQASRVSDYVSISLGIASCIPDVNSSPKELIKKADEALYKAKDTGRNRVAINN